MEVYGEAILARFSKKYPPSRGALQRFLAIVRQAQWPHFTAVKCTFVATDYVAGRLVFNIGGNKYRIVASVDFQEQILVVDEVMTHEQYDRKTI
jgi:mRNA interferase HigB